MFAAKSLVVTGARKLALLLKPTAATCAARRFSSLPSGVPPAGAPPAPASSGGGGGSSLGQRLVAFFAGVGVASSVCGYVVYEELLEANSRVDKTLRSIEKRVQAMEK